jgi:hypothetical protein
MAIPFPSPDSVAKEPVERSVCSYDNKSQIHDSANRKSHIYLNEINIFNL